MITIDFCLTFTALLQRPIRRKTDQQLVDVVERGITVPDDSILSQSDVHSLYDDVHGIRVRNTDLGVKSSSSPVIVYYKVYAFVMANQEAFISRLKQA